MTKVLVTGSAGFIGCHLSKLLLDEGFEVIGYDGMTDYYDVGIKEYRHQILNQYEKFSSTIGLLEDIDKLTALCTSELPDVIVHLAAQAGVRYSLDNPRAYIDSNIVGTFNVMECAREIGVKHLLMASTSSVYGGNENMPFCEVEKADTPLTIYAATKKANESMGHSYAHLWDLPTTMFRFFTVYGPLGRPDMALFKFTKAIIEGTPVDIYNNGQMWRDFTYVDDLVKAIRLLIDVTPKRPKTSLEIRGGDSLSPVAPFRIVNIGNSDKVLLMDYIEAIERAVGKKAIRNLLPMQMGDVSATWANADLLHTLTGYKPDTNFRAGVEKFVKWFREYYKV